ncbi:MAG: septum formation initiator family protein [Clostridiaceae bacterium]|jgi:cell division protein FtsB|nr:septum formation initiator family protein [Clostridiaceae bacterium]
MQKKKKWNIIMLFLMSGLIVYFVVTYFKQQDEILMIQTQIKALEHRISKEEAIQDELLEQQTIIETDEFVEKIAREKLGMVKEGERLFIDMD